MQARCANSDQRDLFSVSLTTLFLFQTTVLIESLVQGNPLMCNVVNLRKDKKY